MRRFLWQRPHRLRHRRTHVRFIRCCPGNRYRAWDQVTFLDRTNEKGACSLHREAWDLRALW